MSTFRIAINVPNLFSVRDFLFTPIWEEMARRRDVQFLLVGLTRSVADVVQRRGVDTIVPIAHTMTGYRWPRIAGGRRPVRSLWGPLGALGGWLDSYLYEANTLRFAAANGLSHYRIRRESTPDGRQRRQVMVEYRRGERPGFPFPTSRGLARAVYGLREWPHWPMLPVDRAWLARLNADLFVFGRVHMSFTPYWARELRRLGVPMVGIVSSWDHPTTKGATSRGMSGYVVASRRMVEEMRDLHGVPESQIAQVGKVQMDRYLDPSHAGSAGELRRRLGVDADARILVLGTNATGLKEHEVSIARRLAADVRAGRYGHAALVIRTHPLDQDWLRDFHVLADPPRVVVLHAAEFNPGDTDGERRDLEDGRLLTALMKHAAVVIQSRGSLALDAIAFDTPVISLAYDGDETVDPRDSFVQEYAFEHYKPLVRARGTWMVGSHDALARAVAGYLADPSRDAQGRAMIRREHIEPFDGAASRRTIDYLVESAQRARAGELPPGDWSRDGAGNPHWAPQQACDLDAYIDR